MQTRLALLLLLAQLLLLPARCFADLQGRQSRSNLDAHVKNYVLDADNLLDALFKVATRFQIPLGVEWSQNQETMRNLSLSWTDADLQQVVKDLVSSYHGYQFDFSGGVVHVFPEWSISSQRDFVNLKVEKFFVRNQVPDAANHQLRELVKLTVSPPPQSGTMAGGTAGSQLGSGPERQINLKLENVTVRDALDQLALTSDRKIWVVTFTADPALTPTGFRRTRTLWNNGKVSDNEEPVWDTFRWGDVTPPLRH